MRSLDSNQISGREAVGVAVIGHWLSKHFDHRDLEAVAAKIGTMGFPNFTDSVLGKQLLDASDIYEQFEKYLDEYPEVGHIYRGTCMGGRTFFITLVATDLGSALRKSAWWVTNLKEILKHKKDLKTVRKVMES